jgi:uncharacterized membrane protein HdeD (DUF308 family)
MLLGLLAIALPHLSTFAVEQIIGALLLLSGVVSAWSCLSMRKLRRIAGLVLIALLSAAAGLLLLFKPVAGTVTLALILVAFFLVAGVIRIVEAIRSRDERGWGWALANGVASLVLAALIVSGWPGTAFWVLGLLFGVDLLFTGASLLAVGWALRQ